MGRGAPLAELSDMRSLAMVCVLLGGCSLYPFGGGDDVCEQDLAVAPPAPERKVNPETLTCEEYYLSPPCNADCGPCAETGMGAGAQYIPPWGNCESECSNLNEASCMSAPSCRVAREHDAYYVNAPSFEGCYEKTYNITGDSFDLPCAMRDAEQCAMGSQCTGLYEINDGALPLHAPRGDFLECIDEAQIAGSCRGVVSCLQVAPTCPASTTPGVANGCWTGSCIPNSVCATTGG